MQGMGGPDFALDLTPEIHLEKFPRFVQRIYQLHGNTQRGMRERGPYL